MGNKYELCACVCGEDDCPGCACMCGECGDTSEESRDSTE